MQIKLTESDFVSCFEPNLSYYVKDKISKYCLIHDELSSEEHNNCLEIIQRVLKSDIPMAGERRQNQWDAGWRENLNAHSIFPKYFGKYDIVRWKQSFVKPISTDYEVNMLHLIVDWIADKYMRDVRDICEFGCGTGHNLRHVRQVNPDATLWGLDWARSSQDIVSNHAINTGDHTVAVPFDFFNPDYSFDYTQDAIIYTVAALEQTGVRYYKFLKYILYHKPKLCIHIEPIEELLDKTNDFDSTSIKYFHKRGYLSGFLTRLREIETEGRAEVIQAQRTYIGSLFVEGYSVIVWKPL